MKMGHHNIRYVGDPNAHLGVWGYPDSEANFCEEDYAFTIYIAEFINTVSNLAYIYLAFQYPVTTRRGAPWYVKHDFMSIALMSVGVCSILFHGSMRQIPQLFDDLSMLLLAGALLHPVYAWHRSTAVQILVGVTTTATIGGVAISYVRSGNILFHSISFVVTLTLVWPRALWIVHRGGRFSAPEKKVMMGHFWRAFWGMVIAYTVWNIDLEVCLPLRALRERIGLPFAWLLELHGWWHILTAYGASHFIRLIRLATATKSKKHVE